MFLLELPRGERLDLALGSCRAHGPFNSRSREGSDHPAELLAYLSGEVSIHTPAREATREEGI